MKKTEKKRFSILLPRNICLSRVPEKKYGSSSTLITNILKKRYKHKNTH